MFGEQKFDIIDTLSIGTGTEMRLVQTERGSRRIESWSSLSKQWNVMYRYNVDDAWQRWKKTADGINARKKETAKKTTPRKSPVRKPVEKPAVKKEPTTRKKKIQNDTV